MSSRYIKRSTMANWYDIPLSMSIPDIVKNYREAKHPVKQIDILADMNETNPSRIAWLLKRAGCDVPAKKLPRVNSKSNTPDYVALWEQSEDARKCDEYRESKILEENEIMSECLIVEVPRKTEPRQNPEIPAADVQQKPKRPAEAVYTDAVDIFWNTYMSVRYNVTLTHEDIMHLIGLSDIARAAAGGAA